MNNKKTFIIVGTTIALILIGLGFWFFSKSTTPVSENPSGSPFGNPGSDTGAPTGNAESGIVGAGEAFSAPAYTPTNRLNRISDTPISGALIISGSTTAVKYIEKATGHMYEVNLSNGSKKRLSNTTLPKSYEVEWGMNGYSAFIKFSEEGSIKNIFATLSTTTSTSTDDGSGELITKNLESGTQNFSFSPSRKTSFYTLVSNQGIQGFLGDKNGEKGSLIWNFPTSEWMVDWPKDDVITLTTKASSNKFGYLYFLNPLTKKTSNILREVPGLITNTSPSGNQVLYSASKNKDTSLFVFDIKSGLSISFSTKTLAEKCVWSDSVIYCAVPQKISKLDLPDDWYLGTTSFSDSIWKITLSTEAGTEEAEYFELEKTAGGPIDAINLEISQDKKTLIFTNKKDSYLWSLNLE